MECPKCNSSTRVIDSRTLGDKNTVRRRRKCESCLHRFTTFEISEDKKDPILKEIAEDIPDVKKQIYKLYMQLNSLGGRMKRKTSRVTA